MYTALKTMGMDDVWRRYRGGGYTEAHQIGPYRIERANDKDDTRIILWNPTRPCVTMVIDRTNNEAAMDAVEYDPDCTSPEKMKRGEGTRAMVDFCLEYLRGERVKKVQLTDRSTIRCNGVRVNLSVMYFLKYGHTWYEKYFGFRPRPDYAEEYEELKEARKLLDIELVQQQPCESFTRSLLRQLPIKINLDFLQVMVWEKTL
jgi:hypothetical protein